MVKKVELSKPNITKDEINEDEINDLDIIKNSWWDSNIPLVPIQEYNFDLYYNSGNNNLLENTLTFAVSNNINFKIFSTWLKIEEVNNDYMFSLEMQNQEVFMES